jgi:hypothetical protein
MKPLLLASILLVTSTPILAAKNCEELKSEIDAKLKAKGVATFTLDVVPTDASVEGQTVGTCDGGLKKIVYKRT